MAIQISGTTVIDNARKFIPVTIEAGGSVGSSGQVLSSTGTGVAWVANGGATNGMFWNNGQTVTSNYTIPASTNSGTFGPVTINTGVTVTITSGSYWVVV
jgi:hypothetical protein